MFVNELFRKVLENSWSDGTNAWSSEHDQWAKEDRETVKALTGVDEDSSDFMAADSASPVGSNVKETKQKKTARDRFRQASYEREKEFNRREAERQARLARGEEPDLNRTISDLERRLGRRDIKEVNANMPKALELAGKILKILEQYPDSSDRRSLLRHIQEQLESIGYRYDSQHNRLTHLRGHDHITLNEYGKENDRQAVRRLATQYQRNPAVLGRLAKEAGPDSLEQRAFDLIRTGQYRAASTDAASYINWNDIVRGISIQPTLQGQDLLNAVVAELKKQGYGQTPETAEIVRNVLNASPEMHRAIQTAYDRKIQKAQMAESELAEWDDDDLGDDEWDEGDWQDTGAVDPPRQARTKLPPELLDRLARSPLELHRDIIADYARRHGLTEAKRKLYKKTQDSAVKSVIDQGYLINPMAKDDTEAIASVMAKNTQELENEKQEVAKQRGEIANIRQQVNKISGKPATAPVGEPKAPPAPVSAQPAGPAVKPTSTQAPTATVPSTPASAPSAPKAPSTVTPVSGIPDVTGEPATAVSEPGIPDLRGTAEPAKVAKAAEPAPAEPAKTAEPEPAYTPLDVGARTKVASLQQQLDDLKGQKEVWDTLKDQGEKIDKQEFDDLKTQLAAVRKELAQAKKETPAQDQAVAPDAATGPDQAEKELEKDLGLSPDEVDADTGDETSATPDADELLRSFGVKKVTPAKFRPAKAVKTTARTSPDVETGNDITIDPGLQAGNFNWHGDTEKTADMFDTLQENQYTLPYKDGEPNLGGYNWNLILNTWDKKEPSVNLQYPSGALTVDIDEIYAILTLMGELSRRKKVTLVREIYSSRLRMQQFINSPRVKSTATHYPKWLRKWQKYQQAQQPVGQTPLDLDKTNESQVQVSKKSLREGSYWIKLQNERNKKLNSLLTELQESLEK